MGVKNQTRGLSKLLEFAEGRTRLLAKEKLEVFFQNGFWKLEQAHKSL